MDQRGKDLDKEAFAAIRKHGLRLSPSPIAEHPTLICNACVDTIKLHPQLVDVKQLSNAQKKELTKQLNRWARQIREGDFGPMRLAFLCKHISEARYARHVSKLE